MRLNRSFIFSSWVLLVCILFTSSCSLTFEKRRYRPGYHVDMVKSHSDRSMNDNDKVLHTNKQGIKAQLLPTGNIAPELKVIEPVISNDTEYTNSDNSLVVSNRCKKSNGVQRKKHLHAVKGGKKLYHINKTKSLEGRKAAAWVLGGLSLLVAIIGAALSTIGYGIGLAILGICLGIAALFAIIALLVRFIGPTKQQEENPPPYVPVNSQFINGSFIFSIITLAIALLGFVFGFLIYPFGIVAFSIGIVAGVAAILSFSLGFRALKDDKSFKTKLIIIFGFIALILAALAILLVFL